MIHILTRELGYTRESRTRHGTEYHAVCPWCGVSPAQRRGDFHFSYGAKGGKCFVCGNGASLGGLAKLVGDDGFDFVQPDPEPVPDYKPPDWVGKGAGWYRQRYPLNDKTFDAWANDKKAVPPEVVEANHFGLGRLPGLSHCNHERLIVPVIDAHGRIANIRGRQIACKCSAKWLAPAGWRLENLDRPFGYRAVTADTEAIWIMENPVDAALFTWHYRQRGWAGIATLSTSYWNDEWSGWLAEYIGLDSVIVIYDNDLPGNGGAARRSEMIRAWAKKHDTALVPKAAGVALVRRLQERLTGTQVHLFDWGDNASGADVGSMLEVVG